MQRGHGLRPKGMFRHVLSIWQGGLHELVELANWLGNVKSLQKAPSQVHFRSSTHFVPRMKHVLSHKHSNNTWPNTSGRSTSVRTAMPQSIGHHQLIDFIRKAMQLHSKNCIQCHLLDVKIFLSQSHWTTIFHMGSHKGLITDHFDLAQAKGCLHFCHLHQFLPVPFSDCITLQLLDQWNSRLWTCQGWNIFGTKTYLAVPWKKWPPLQAFGRLAIHQVLFAPAQQTD